MEHIQIFRKDGESKLINILRGTAKYSKNLLIFCTLMFMIACSSVLLQGSQAFAATRPHTSRSIVPKSMQNPSSVDTIGPAWNFNGCGTGWSEAIDTNLQYFQYSYTTGNQSCTSAVWNDSVHTLGHICHIDVYIPTLFATANITYGIVDANGTERFTINQNNVSGWQPLYGNSFPILKYQSIDYVYISSNNGQTGTDMAAGQMRFTCF